MFDLAVRTLDAIDLTMLPLEVSRVNEGRSFILKLPRSCIMTVGSAKVDHPVRHRRSPCEDYDLPAAAPTSDGAAAPDPFRGQAPPTSAAVPSAQPPATPPGQRRAVGEGPTPR